MSRYTVFIGYHIAKTKLYNVGTILDFPFLFLHANWREDFPELVRSAYTYICANRLKIGRRSLLFPFALPSGSFRRHHLRRRISIFSIRPNLIDMVHRALFFARRINNTTMHNTYARRRLKVPLLKLDMRETHAPRLHISDRRRDGAVTIMMSITSYYENWNLI